MNQTLHLRLVTQEDCQKIFEWRNHEWVRQYSLSSEEINFTDHQAWFAKMLNNSDLIMLVAEMGQCEMGVFRLDIKGVNAEVSIYLNPTYIGKGYGEKLLAIGIAWAKNHLPHVKTLEAIVISDNMSSVRIFEKQGFLKERILYKKNM